IIAGEVPSLLNKPKGCAFCPRCPKAMDICRDVPPPLRVIGDREVACHLY
ncbi:oligopeptide/dipeptide ABC transporter ATP-binding protein, partial [Brucella abortus]